MPEQCLHSRTEPAYIGTECCGRKCRLCGVLLVALRFSASERIEDLEAQLAALRKFPTTLHVHALGDDAWGVFTPASDGPRMLAKCGGPDAETNARLFARAHALRAYIRRHCPRCQGIGQHGTGPTLACFCEEVGILLGGEAGE